MSAEPKNSLLLMSGIYWKDTQKINGGPAELDGTYVHLQSVASEAEAIAVAMRNLSCIAFFLSRAELLISNGRIEGYKKIDSYLTRYYIGDLCSAQDLKASIDQDPTYSEEDKKNFHRQIEWMAGINSPYFVCSRLQPYGHEPLIIGDKVLSPRDGKLYFELSAEGPKFYSHNRQRVRIVTQGKITHLKFGLANPA